MSVRPSVRDVRISVETNKHIFKLLSLSGSHTILVFPQYADGNPQISMKFGTHPFLLRTLLHWRKSQNWRAAYQTTDNIFSGELWTATSSSCLSFSDMKEQVFVVTAWSADVRCCAATYRFRDSCGQMAKHGVERPKVVHPKSFLTMDSVTSKDIATNRGEALSGTQLYNRAKFHADRCHRRRHICPRIPAFRLPYNNFLIAFFLHFWRPSGKVWDYSIYIVNGIYRQTY